MKLICYLIYLNIAVLPAVIALSSGQSVLGNSQAREVRDELIKAEIIPTVLDDFVPEHVLRVEWSSKQSASLGNTLKPSDLQKPPTITLLLTEAGSASCNPKLTYTIAATDPDAPSRDNPEWSEFCHWITTGLSASTLSDGSCGLTVSSVGGLKDIISYKPPGPPEKTGKHRYVFVVYAPYNGTTDPLSLSKPGERQHWGTGKERHGVRDWAVENGLVPVAANFIYAQNDKQ